MKKKLFTLTVLLCLQVSTKICAQPVQIKEIPKGSYGFFTALENFYFFDQDSLWTSDGTVTGTHFVKDLGSRGITMNSQEAYATNSVFFFITYNGSSFTLWRSNGTGAGTVAVAVSNIIVPLGIVSGSFLYVAQAGTSIELYKVSSDAPTMVKAFDEDSDIIKGVHTDNTLYFEVRSTSHHTLWKTNGTNSGTVPVKDFNRQQLSQFTASGSTLFFLVNGILWKSNGTPAGTVLVRELGESSYLSGISEMISYKGLLYFIESSEESQHLSLYATNGTEAGTRLIYEGLEPGYDPYTDGMRIVNGLLTFTVYSAGDFTKDILYRSDGTHAGTLPVSSLDFIGNPVFTQNHLFFTGIDDENTDPSLLLWQSDLTPEGTKTLNSLFPGTSITYKDHLTVAGNILFFTMTDSSGHVYLWKYNPMAPATSSRYFTLVDADSNKDLSWLKNNDTIVLYPGDNINIRYNPLTEPGSVAFGLNNVYFSTENVRPFAVAGDNNGNYHIWNVAQGRYTLSAREYTGDNGTGILLRTVTVSFYVKKVTLPSYPIVNAGPDKVILPPATSTTLTGTASDPGGNISAILWEKLFQLPGSVITDPNALSTTVIGLSNPGLYRFRITVMDNSGLVSADEVVVQVTGPAITYFVIVDATTDTALISTSGSTVSISAAHAQNMNVVAYTKPYPVGSVEFVRHGITTIENQPPYALFGDLNGDYKPGTLSPGTHVITATPYAGANASGQQGYPAQLTIQVQSPARSSIETSSVQVRCFPNPSSGPIHIHVPVLSSGHSFVAVYNQTGQLKEILYDGEAQSGQGLNLSWGSETTDACMYFLKVKAGDSEHSEKLIIY